MPRDGTFGRRVLASQNTVYAAVLALLALVAGLTWHARRSERSHQETVTNALRDYAAVAAWQFERDVQGRLSSHLQMSLAEVRRLRLTREGSLPEPQLLTVASRSCGCGFRDEVLFAFRIDLPRGRTTLDRRTAPKGVVPALERLGPQLRDLEERDAHNAQRAGNMPAFASLRFDTLAGRAYALAYQLVHDQQRAARAIYGIAVDARHLAQDFKRVFVERALLPPSLVGRIPNDSVVRLRVVHPVIGDLFVAANAPAIDDIAVSDTMDRRLGGMVTTLSLQPGVRQSLLIQGPPRTALPIYLLMLGIAAALALVALLQLRRSRALTRLREQFVANVSHELRTPLAQISMFSETLLLDRERSPQEGRHFLSVIYREARRLSAMVENVLRLSRGDSGAGQLAPEYRNMSDDVRDTVDEFAPLARRSSVSFRTELPEQLWAHIDPGALRQILLNLLDNAVKFGPRAQTITVRAARTNGIVKISVEDQGPGIAPADRTRVFEPFARLNGAGRASAPGTGIGLSVVRDLVAAHGGSVWIEDTGAPNDTANGSGVRVGFSVPSGDKSHALHA